jgi:hypothetical protein
MTTEQDSPRIIPDQPAANSGAAVGFVFGAFCGIALAMAPQVRLLTGSFASPAELVGYNAMLGTVGGLIIGAMRDRAKSKSND